MQNICNLKINNINVFLLADNTVDIPTLNMCDDVINYRCIANITNIEIYWDDHNI